jgi:hypothetical protein
MALFCEELERKARFLRAAGTARRSGGTQKCAHNYHLRFFPLPFSGAGIML